MLVCSQLTKIVPSVRRSCDRVTTEIMFPSSPHIPKHIFLARAQYRTVLCRLDPHSRVTARTRVWDSWNKFHYNWNVLNTLFAAGLCFQSSRSRITCPLFGGAEWRLECYHDVASCCRLSPAPDQRDSSSRRQEDKRSEYLPRRAPLPRPRHQT